MLDDRSTDGRGEFEAFRGVGRRRPLAVEEKLNGLGTSAEQFQRRVESKEFLQYLASGVLQTQRTIQENRLRRMAWIIANGVKEGDLDPESGDDLMRAAVELRDFDLWVLTTLLEQQQKTTTSSLGAVDGIINRPREVWRPLNESGFLTTENYMKILTSLERLKSVGFCADVQTTDPSWLPHALATPLGETFIKRVREIAV